MKRWLLGGLAVLLLAGVGVAVWLNWPTTRGESDLGGVVGDDAPASDAEFATLVEADPVRALRQSVTAYTLASGGGFTGEFRKRERRDGTLKGEEVIRVTVKDDPHSVLMVWKSGGGLGKATLWVKGQNDGNMLVDMPLIGAKGVPPQSNVPRLSARYTIEEFGVKQSTQKTLKAWATARDDGKLKYEYLGRKVAAEAGGRECFVLKRTCPEDQIDPFISGGDPVAVTDANRKDSFRTVTVYLDCETRWQVGTEQHRHDGELTASYWFRDVRANPAFDADTFTVKSFK
jgi:Protein of unknown function (DUF1571)